MDEKKNFLGAAGMSAGLFAFVATALALYNGYSVMNAEPTGSPFPPGTIGNMVVCLIGAFAAMMTVKLHVADEPEMLIGRGAVIGLVTGLLLAVFMTLFSMAWEFADPEYSGALVEAMKRHFEAIPNFSEEQIEEIIADVEKGFTPIGRLKGLGISAAVSGVLNALTGMLGAKFFASRPAESL